MLKRILSIITVALLTTNNAYGFWNVSRLLTRMPVKRVPVQQPKRSFWSLIKKSEPATHVTNSTENSSNTNAPVFSSKLSQQTGIVILGLLADLKKTKDTNAISGPLAVILDSEVTRMCNCWSVYDKITKNMRLDGLYNGRYSLEKQCLSVDQQPGNSTLEGIAQQINGCPNCLEKILSQGKMINYYSKNAAEAQKK